MSSIRDGTTFFAPLAYLAATLLTALYFSQVWLFTMSAFGVVWLDSQMAWRAQKLGQAKMQQHITETFERVQRSGSAPKEQRVVAAAPAKAVKEPTTQVEEETEQPVAAVVEATETPAENTERLVVDATQAPVEEITVEHVEEVIVPPKADSVNGDHHSPSSGDDESSSSNGYSDESRPYSPATSVSSTNDDDVSDEPLEKQQQEEEEEEEELRPQFEHTDSGIAMEMDLDEALVFDKQFDPVVFPSFEAALEADELEVPETQFELVFPSVEEHLEAVFAELLMQKTEVAKIEEQQIEEPTIEEPKIEEQQIEEPKIEEPTIEEPKIEDVVEEEPEIVEEPEIEVPEFEVPEIEEPITEHEKQVEPTFFADDATPLLAEHEEHEAIYEVPEKKVEPTFPIAPQQLDEKRPILVRGSSSRSSQKPKRIPKKNNGWKSVPKKARLSASAKQRFLSRAFW
ncbi:hypothetical protein FN846DRAFT_482144 [Sphaerosporella brunnea]|uniref:Uncharacterized protein n=1 Tax=Sphaerosporella brunnea TaxID=1250544 RepID=A0A5J5FC26_9PEZI|nr:hypothetical protein FN846DRAFT_482144 [Sphaerosporella brunnea]